MTLNQTFHVDKQASSDYHVRETWYGDEVQRQYISTVHIHGIWRACISINANPQNLTKLSLMSSPGGSFQERMVGISSPFNCIRLRYSNTHITKSYLQETDGTTKSWASFCLKQELEDVTAKGIPARVATNLNNTKPPQLPGGLWSFHQGDPGSHLLM